VLWEHAPVHVRIEESANTDKIIMLGDTKENTAASFQRLHMSTQSQGGAGKNLCVQMAVAAVVAKCLGVKT
jgi:hypothetical protein